MNPTAAIQSGKDAIRRGHWEGAVSAGTALIDSGEAWVLHGLSMRAYGLEHWSEGPQDRLEQAADDWRSFIRRQPDPLGYLGLARIAMKTGDRKAAFESLSEAERRGGRAAACLGLADFYRTAEPPDMSSAKRYYLRAALLGRIKGIQGYAEVTNALDQMMRCMAIALFGLIATPVWALFLGKRRFEGY